MLSYMTTLFQKLKEQKPQREGEWGGGGGGRRMILRGMNLILLRLFLSVCLFVFIGLLFFFFFFFFFSFFFFITLLYFVSDKTPYSIIVNNSLNRSSHILGLYMMRV